MSYNWFRKLIVTGLKLCFFKVLLMSVQFFCLFVVVFFVGLSVQPFFYYYFHKLYVPES